MTALSLCAAVTDWRLRRIPNGLTVAGFIAGVILNTQAGGFPGFGHALAGAGMALLIHVPLFALGLTGGGDVKLMTALGAILGPQDWLVLFVLSSILGAIAALVIVARRGALGRTLANVGHLLTAVVRGRRPDTARSELSIDHQQSVTLPRGVVVAGAAVLFLLGRG